MNNTDNILHLSHSKIKTFLHCRQKYIWEYQELLAPKETSKALQVGDIVHQLLHLYYTKELTLDKVDKLSELIKTIYPDNSEELTQEVVQQSALLLQGYLQRWKDDSLNVISSEIWAEVDLGDNVTLSGRIDALSRSETDKLWRVEHKTAARVDSAYLSGLKGGLQGAIYDFLIEQMFQENIEGTIYNLLVKTTIPKYERSYAKAQSSSRKMMLHTIEGVIRDIRRGDFYPSFDCFLYNSVCPFKPLCDYDTQEVRNVFYKPRESPLTPKA